jgi:hypothetical protein
LSAFVGETQGRAEADARSGRVSPRFTLPSSAEGARWHIGFLLRLTQSRMRQNGIGPTMVQILKYLTIRLPLRLLGLVVRQLKPSNRSGNNSSQRAER